MNFGNTKLILGNGGSAIGSPLDSHIILYTNNREQFKFTDDGKLKIGTKGSIITTYQDSHLIFHTNKYERLRINDQGRVGIGTKDQKAVLQITKTNNINTEEAMLRVNFNESWGLKLSQHNDGSSTVVITETGRIDSKLEFDSVALNTGGFIWIYNGITLISKLTILSQPTNQVGNYIWIAGASVNRNVFRWSDTNELEYQGAYLKDCIEAAGGTWPAGWSYQSNWYDYDNVHTSPPGDGESTWYIRTTDQTKTVDYNTYTAGNVRYELNQRGNDINYGVLHIKDGDIAIATINEGGSLRKGKVGIGIRAPVVALHMEHTDAIKIPKGTTAERPTANNDSYRGYIRYNTTLNKYEGYGMGPNWRSLEGVLDQDQDTYILAESTSGADNDELWFYTAGAERMIIKNDGRIGIEKTDPFSRLHIQRGTNSTTNIAETRIRADDLHLLLGGVEWANTSNEGLYIMGFGYVQTASSYPPVYIGHECTSSPNNTFGDLVFGTRADGTNVQAAERMRIKSDGNIGIGTFTFVDTRSILHIKENTGISFQADTDQTDSRNWRIRQDDYGALGSFQISVGSNNTDFGDSSSDVVMTMLKNRNVGIGTTSPLHKLHIANLEINNTIQDLICLETQTSSEAGDPAVSGIAQGILFKNKWHTNSTKYSMARISAHSQPGYGGQLAFWTNNGANSPDDILLERLRINEDGNVGIGTTTPSGKLNIENLESQEVLQLYQRNAESYGANPDAAPSNSSYSPYNPKGTVINLNSVGSSAQTNASLINFNAYGPNGGNTGVYLGNVSSGDNNGSGNLVFGRRTGATSWSESMRINNSGNIGIGTNNPDRKVHIVGNVRIEGTLTTNGGTTIVHTNTSTTERLSVTNDGTGPAIIANQLGSQPVVDFQDDGNSVFYIEDGGDIGINTNAPDVALHINHTDAIKVPKGTTAERPAASTDTHKGYVRYNTTLDIFEGYGMGPNWRSLEGVLDEDQDTYIKAESTAGADNDELWFYTLGLERMRILNNGNIGIGTTSPNAPLEIHGGAGSGDEVLILSNSKDSSYTDIHSIFLDGGAHYDVYNNSTIQTGKSTSSGEAFHINRYSAGNVTMVKGGGNVGIGTTSPIVALHINHTDAMKVPKGTTAQRPTASTESHKGYVRYNTTLDIFEGFGAGPAWGSLGGVIDVDQDTYIKAESTAGADNDELWFYTLGSERMRILNNGNIGIGTTGPQTKLHIEDRTHNTGSGDGLIPGLSGNTANNKPQECLRLTNSYTYNGNGPLLRFTNYHASGSNPSNDEYNLGGIAGYDVRRDWGGGLCFFTAPNTSGGGDLTARMVIDDRGYVGIGTTVPFGKLDIKHSNWTQTPTASTMSDMLNLMVSAPSTTGENNMRTLLCFADGYRNNSAIKDSYRVRTRMSGAGFDMIWNSSSTETIGANTSNNNFIFARDYTSFRNKNVGIGTLSPSQLLHIFNTSAAWNVYANIRLSTDTNNGNTYYGEIGYFRGTSNNTDEALVFSGRDASRKDMVILSSNGDVGIGTQSPETNLHVHGGSTGGTAFNNSVLLLSGTSTVNYGLVGMKFNMRTGASGAKSAIFSKDYAGTWNRSSLVFATNNESNTNDASLSDAKMVIRETGNVGIGTTSPEYNLDIRGTGYVSQNIYSDNTGWAATRYGSNGGGNELLYVGAANDGTCFINSRSDYPLIFMQNNSEVMRIHDNGNVGIGTTNPDDKLHISGSGDTVLKIVSTNATSPGIELVRTSLNHPNHHYSSTFADDAWTDWKIYNNGSKLEFQAGYRTAPSGNHLSTSPQTLVTTMTMLNDGNVGIGTTSPGYLLDLRKDVASSSGNKNEIGINVVNEGSYSGSYLKLGRLTTGLHLNYSREHSSSIIPSLGSHHGEIYTSGNYGLYIGTNNTPRISILGTGNVGIGTTSPSGILHVKGSDPKIFLHDTDTSSTTADVQLYFCESDGSGDPNHSYRIRYNNRDLVFGEGDYGGTYTTAMALHESTVGGNIYVGIGNATPSCGLQVGTESTSSLLSSVKMARYIGFGYKEFFPSGAYSGLSCDNHATFCIGQNTHINNNNEIRVTNTHPTNVGTAICMPGNAQPNQGGMYFFTKNPTSVTAGNVAYDLDTSIPSMMINGSGTVGIGTRNLDRGLCILDNQNTGQSIGNYYIGYNSSYQESASLKILQHLPISSSTYRTSDGGGNGDPAINIVASYVGSGANSTSHLGGSIQFTTQTRDNPTSGGGHGQAYAGIYGGRHSGYTTYEGEMIFYTADTTNRASGANLNPRMTIKGASVGIATTSPSGRLHTVGSSGIHALRVTGNSGSSAQVYITGANYGIRVTSAASSGSYYSAFFEGSTGKGLYVRDDGNVGINDTTPSYKLDVNGDINFTGTLRQNGSVFSNDPFPYNAGSVSGTAIIGKIRVGSWNYGSYDYMSIQHHSLGWASVTGNYALRQDATGVTDINCASSKSIGFLCNNEYKMYMNSSGQFSINNSSAVMQDAKISANVPDEGTFLCSPDISQYIWRINNAVASAWGIYWSTNGSGNNEYLHSDSNPNQIVFVGNGTSRASIDLDNGNVITTGWYHRTSHYNGGLCGSYNSVGANEAKTNPIYVIGSNYQPNETTLGNMYGIGFTSTTTFTGTQTGGGWGLYAASDGDVRWFANAGSGSTYQTSWVRVGGTNGLYFQDYGGGWHMTDSTYIRSYNNKPVMIFRDDDGDNTLVELLRLQRHANDESSSAFAEGGYISMYVTDDNDTDYEGARISFRSDNGANNETSGRIGFWTSNAGNPTQRVSIDKSGNMIVTGDITAFGSISDLKLKENINELDTKLILDKVLQLKPVSFKWIDDLENEKRKGKNDEGFIAQEVEKIWPMLVDEFETLKEECNDKFKYIHYNKLTVYTTGAIQEQQKQINKLKQDKETQKKEITELRNENNMLKEQMKSVLERLAALESK